MAHRAAILGCVISVSVLIQSGADFTLKDQGGRSALDLARLLNNQQCYEIAAKKKSPLPVTDTPPPARGAVCMYLYMHDNFIVLVCDICNTLIGVQEMQGQMHPN